MTSGDATTPEFPPHILREYALVADGERGALLGPKGDMTWMCAPRWDSDAIFSSLIGGKGVYALSPSASHYVWGGYYEDGSLIWRDRWTLTDGIVECREALAFPADPSIVVVLRQVVARDGPAEVTALLDPRAEFGRKPFRDLEQDGEIVTGRTGRLYVRWSGAAGAKPAPGGGMRLDLRVPAGSTHDLVLEIAEQPFDSPPPNPGGTWEATEAAWQAATPELGETLAPRDARHAYVVLRGLTSSGGGMVAAATMSLPERAERGANYDYRYAWIRDQAYVGQAVAVTRPHPLLDDAVGFIADRLLEDGPKMKPAYRVDGSPVPDERRLTHLAGYPGGSDKVGNWVNKQFQLDAFGEALLVFSSAARHERLASEHWRAVELAVDAIEDHWQGPDAGIWELEDRHWTHSRLTCVAGLRSIARHASPAQAVRWSALADAILAKTAAEGVHPSGRWQRAPDDPRIDAALLLPAIRGALPPEDPRSIATVDAVRAELSQDGYVYRFRHDERPLGEAEGAFLLCGFLMALATRQEDKRGESVAWFERSRASCGPSGLLTEEFDVAQRQLRGNIPQAFVHALLLESATRLERLEDQ